MLLCVSQAVACAKPTQSDNGVHIGKLTSAGIEFQTAEIDLSKANLQLYYRKPDGARFGNFESLQNDLAASGHQLLFAANAGIFDPNHVPCGLTVVAGHQEVPLNLKDGFGNFYMKPNGVFLVRANRAMIVDATQYPSLSGQVQFATQSGPLLLQAGQINPRFNARSSNRRIRSGIGLRADGMVLLAISEQPVTFYDLAALFRDQLHCPVALYLDGDISTFYWPGKAPDSIQRDYAAILAVTAPQ